MDESKHNRWLPWVLAIPAGIAASAFRFPWWGLALTCIVLVTFGLWWEFYRHEGARRQ
jgi:hypothetical protein